MKKRKSAGEKRKRSSKPKRSAKRALHKTRPSTKARGTAVGSSRRVQPRGKPIGAKSKHTVLDKRKLVEFKKLELLRDQLREAQETLDAIRNGEVDAVVVHGSHGNQIYSLVSADQPYRVYIEQMQEGAVTIAPDGLILYANRRFAEMVDVPMERVISTSIQNYLPADVWPRLLEVFQPGGNVVKHECMLACASALPVYLTGSKLAQQDEEVLCLIVTDLTHQKEHQSMQIAKESAEKANLAKDNFLATLSHELRTPLTPALMAAASLEQDPNIPENFRHDLAIIRRNVELEARLIDDLLDLTRIARGKLELHPADMDIHLALQRAIDICQPDIRGKGLNLTARFDAFKTRTVGDAVRVQQAFWNLIRNAVKFTPPGGSISVSTVNPSPDEFVVQIVDNGIGFEPERAEQIFAAFEQGGRQITREFGGLGLGLAICRSIIASHGGTIEGTSEGHNRGATFTVHLPLRSISSIDPNRNPASPTVSEALDRLRILLVEDHADTRAGMAKLLGRDHDVHTADSAAQALQLAGTHSFDLVISDLGLPDRSGLELMRELRRSHNLKGICISGYGMEGDITNSRDAGFVHHLTKPISFDRLRHAIKEATTKLN